MSDNYDISTKRLTGVGAAGIGRARIRMIVATLTGAGRITITDGSGGATRVDLDFAAAGTYDIMWPGTGTLCQNDPFVSTATSLTAMTLFWS